MARAIYFAGALLENSGNIMGEYTVAKVKSVENGSYIVVAPGFAFAHACSVNTVKNIALSWGVLLNLWSSATKPMIQSDSSSHWLNAIPQWILPR